MMTKTTHHTFRLILLVAISSILFGCAGLKGEPRAKPDYIEPVTAMEFAFIKGGSFQMGDTVDNYEREKPVHTVTLEDFAVGMYEVTFKQYDKFCKATGREKPSDEGWGRGDRPVINVTWDDAKAFAAWLSAETNLNISLPSEAQWEYFARAGTTGRYWTGDTLPKNMANCRDCGSKWDGKKTAPVGMFKANPWNIYDTAGNAAEWTLDDQHKSYQGAPVDGTAWTDESKEKKMYRGGGWSYDTRGMRVAARDWNRKWKGYNEVGFRVIVVSPPFQAQMPEK